MALDEEETAVASESAFDAILVLAVEIRQIARENSLPVAEAAASLLIIAMLRDSGSPCQRSDSRFAG